MTAAHDRLDKLDKLDKPAKTLMRSLGEFVGHIVKGIRSDPAKGSRPTVVRKTVEEEARGDVVLRRTTIEEVELKGRGAPAPRSDANETREKP